MQRERRLRVVALEIVDDQCVPDGADRQTVGMLRGRLVELDVVGHGAVGLLVADDAQTEEREGRLGVRPDDVGLRVDRGGRHAPGLNRIVLLRAHGEAVVVLRRQVEIDLRTSGAPVDVCEAVDDQVAVIGLEVVARKRSRGSQGRYSERDCDDERQQSAEGFLRASHLNWSLVQG